MSYHVVIEGTLGARLVRRGILPRRGEWLSVALGEEYLWLPVQEVSHVLSGEEALPEVEEGCRVAHAFSEAIVFTSLALGVRAEVATEADGYKLLLPPTRWPLGGRGAEEEGLSAVSSTLCASPKRHYGREP